MKPLAAADICPAMIAFKRMKPSLSCLALFFAACAAASIAAAQTWMPARNVEIIVGSGPGGGADVTGRLIQKLMQKLAPDVSMSVVNKTGGGSALSYVYLNQHPGDGHYLALSLQPMITTPLM